jgi:DNA-binding CsgD family transcriptional regulator
MRHIPFLLDLACLAVGIACLARLSLAYALKRDASRLSRLAFFAAYTYLMAVGVLFCYYLVNVGGGLEAQRAFASLIFLGMAALEAIFPWMMRPEAEDGKSVAPPRAAFIAAAVTALQAGSIWLFPDSLSFVPLALAFLPFSAVVAWVILRAKRAKAFPAIKKGDAALLLLYAPILALAAWEILFLFRDDPKSGYVLLSLPLAYALSALQFLKHTAAREVAPPGDSAIELSAAMAEAARLTARETQMAKLILEGKENKEIARALRLSENTVRNHIHNLYQKLGIQRRMDLVRLIREENAGTGTKLPGESGPLR